MIELFKAILNNDLGVAWTIGSILLATFFWKYEKYRHKRYRSQIVLLAFIFGITGSLHLYGFLVFPANVAIILLCAALAGVSYLTTVKSKTVFPETRSIAYLKTLVRKGKYSKIEKRFLKRPFWIMSIPGRKEWGLLWAKNLMLKNCMREAYDTYSDLLKLPLFKQEADAIRINQARILLEFGDTIGAKKVFEQVSAEQKKENNSLVLQALFDERTGDLANARHDLLLATRDYEREKDYSLVIIYNQLARMEKFLGNTVDIIHYFRKAAELAGQLEEKYLIHITFPNLIDNYLQNNDRKDALHFLNVYAGLIDKDNVDDLLQFNNYRMEYARQVKDRELYLESIETGRTEILPKLSRRESLIFEIGDLRIRWNSGWRWDEQLASVAHHLPEYLALEFPARYYALKEMFDILRARAERGELRVFAALFVQLGDLMVRSKVEIDKYVLDLPDYCVDERCYWEEQKVFLRRFQQENEPKKQLIDLLQDIFNHLKNIKDIQIKHGNPLPAIEADLNIADDCMGFLRWVQEPSVQRYLRLTMERHVNGACVELAKFSFNPVFALRVARYALYLDDKVTAKRNFDDFLQSKISILHYSQWLQGYYADLVEVFN